MHDAEFVARNLAAALLAGRWTKRALARRMESVLGRETRADQKTVLFQLLALAPQLYPPSPAWLVAFLLAADRNVSSGDEPFDVDERPTRLLQVPEPCHLILRPPLFAPAERFRGLDIPKLPTPGDLARWLVIPVEHLDWFSDETRQHGRTDIPILQHYSYAFVPKSSGPPRLIEAPKPRLKSIQRGILHGILDKVPAHASAHGFVEGRSALTAAQIHVGEDIVITIDLADFFPSTPLRRVHALFRSLGFPWASARCLSGLCSTSTPRSVFFKVPAQKRHPLGVQRRYASPHLPQGAPTSPALANLAAWRLDTRLAGLAKAYDARYTRYADDLAFSGSERLASRADSFLDVVETIIEDEGYTLNARKTRIMRRSARQRVTGLVVNNHLNVPRESYDALKAILYNCARNGAEAENRSGDPDFRAHLDGRIGWVEQVNPQRGAKLRAMFRRVAWP